MGPSRVALLLALAVTGISTARASAAEWQFKPFLGATYGGSTTFLFVPQLQSGAPAHLVFGGSGMFLGEFLGVEGDFGHTPSFFQDSSNPIQLIADSGVTTVTGNVVLAVPRHLVQYSLRPYIVGGAGVMHVGIDYVGNPISTSSTLKTMDLGAGVTGFLTKHLGVTWDVRYFRSIDRTIETGQSIGSEHLSFWRANMAVAIRL
ncbi:MAG TPA: outer membrane beta-barrel protein [Vicinamibacterales bacterium]|nr:outer membrane beta-barrel protein [Vicinamibacterales bacterium]